MVDVDDSSLQVQTDSQPKFVGLFWRLPTTWRCSTGWNIKTDHIWKIVTRVYVDAESDP